MDTQEIPKTEEPVAPVPQKEQKPKKKYPKKKGQQKNKDAAEKEGGEQTDKPKRKPREKKYVYNEDPDWKEKLKTEVTNKTKIPPKRKKEDLMARPDREVLNKKLKKTDAVINKKKESIKALYEEKDKLRKEDIAKNNEGWGKFNLLKDERDAAKKLYEEKKEELNFDKLKKLRETRQNKFRDLIEKSPFKGVAKTMEDAKKYIDGLKLNFRDVKKTAKEEKAMKDQIEKFEKGLNHFQKVEDARIKMEKAKEDFKLANQQIKALDNDLYHKRKKANKKWEELQEEKKLKEESQPEGTKEEKAKRPLTAGEKEIVKKVDKIRKEIDALYEEKRNHFDDFDKEMVKYREDHFQFAKDNYIAKLVYDLQREERQKKWEEDQKKREEEKVSRAKEARKEIFTSEIDKCKAAISILKLLSFEFKQDQKMSNTNQAAPVEDENNQLEIADENLQIISKKPKEVVVTPVSKKLKKKFKKKKGNKKTLLDMMPKKEASTLHLITPDIIETLTMSNIAVPTQLSEVDGTLEKLSKKEAEFLALRERYVNEEQFEGDEKSLIKNAERVMLKNRDYDDENQEEEIKEKKPQKKNNAKPKKPKLTNDESDFPSL
jgi:hypothetical protein